MLGSCGALVFGIKWITHQEAIAGNYGMFTLRAVMNNSKKTPCSYIPIEEGYTNEISLFGTQDVFLIRQ